MRREGSTPELPPPSGQAEPPASANAAEPEFRWQALFQRSRDALFVLNRQRRFLFVNRAWEELSGVTAAEARGLACRRRALLPEDPQDLIIRTFCCPPPEVLDGSPGRQRRLLPRGSSLERWWIIDFLPLRDEQGTLCILGRIEPAPALASGTSPAPAGDVGQSFGLPDKLVTLRETLRQRFSLDRLIARSPAMLRVREQARLASRTSAPVLLVGERGTGKQWLARTIHYLGGTEGGFAAVDCARLPPASLEAALFGPRRIDHQLGRGTRYLHEVHRLPRDLQLRLVESLQATDDGAGLRTVAGCTGDPEEEVRQQRFLEALHCALTPLVIRLPALRERLTDLPELVEFFLQGLPAEEPVALAAETWDVLRAYAWPANLSELYEVLQSAASRATGHRLEPADLPSGLRVSVRLEQTAGPESSRPLSLDHLLEQAERRLILLALRRAQGNRSRAAQLLSIWRPRLLRRIEALGIRDGEW
jgi:transcriptional regulator with PAS, ATPase and Fis domain